MRRGVTAFHIFTLPFENLNPKALQITYKQGNRIILQKQLMDIEIYPLLFRNMKLDDEGNIIVDEESIIVNKENQIIPPSATIISKDIIVNEGYMYYLTKDSLEPETGVLAKLSQEETMLFDYSDYAVVQVRILMQDDTSYVSTISRFKIEDCLDNNFLPIEETPFLNVR